MRTLLIGAAAMLAGCAAQAASPAASGAAGWPSGGAGGVHRPGNLDRLDPDRITLTSLYWGRVTETWSIPRGGEGRWSQADGSARTFPVSQADFDRLRDLFRSWEGVDFHCARIIADGPYGHVTWSQPGREDQRLEWDAGCVSGDATEVFQRLNQAYALLKALRESP